MVKFLRFAFVALGSWAELFLNWKLSSGFEDVTMMSKAVEQRGGHLGITEDARPFAAAQVGGDDDARVLVVV